MVGTVPTTPSTRAAWLQTLESAAFEAWPSAHSTDFKGWRIRLDRGHTKRANSANATLDAQPLEVADIDSIEAQFAQRGLTPTFRLPAFAPVAKTDALLERRGYRRVDAACVMTRSLSNADDAVADSPAQNAAAWLDAFQEISGDASAAHPAHLEILQRIAHPCTWALHAENGLPLSCALGVQVDETLGIFDVATRATHRQQGLAEHLCRGILAWGYQRGARTAFLQVIETNPAAIRLYEKLGFRTAYAYWYRVQTT